MVKMAIVAAVAAAAFTQAAADVSVKVDLGKELGVIKPVNGFGQGPILGWNNFSMFKYLQRAGIPYVRYHDVAGAFGGNRFVDIPNIFRDFDADENDPKNYDFKWTDTLVEATCANGAYPFFRLGVTIENEANRIKPYRIYPPKDFAKWARICEHVIRHYNEGWANGYKMGIKYWEIWNEPDDVVDLVNGSYMWRGTFEQYLDLYRVASKHLKKCFPDIKVGGYASCGFYAVTAKELSPAHKAYVDRFYQFLDFVKKENCPLDFFSYHSYAGEVGEIGKHIAFARKTLDEKGFKNIETSLNEWHSGAWLKDRGTAAHAARQAAFLLTFQRGAVDTAMFYDARVGTTYYGGIFNPMTLKPFKSYSAFLAFNELRRRGKEVSVECVGTNVYATAARGNEDVAVMIVNNEAVAKPFKLDIAGAKVLSATIMDDSRDWEQCELPATLPPNSILLVTFKAATSLKDEAGNLYLFRRGDYGVPSYRIPAVACAKGGTLVAVCDARHWDARDLHARHPIRIVCRRSTDGGKTWSASTETWPWPWKDDVEEWGASDPSIVADADTGKVFLFYNVTEHVKWQKENGTYNYKKFVQESSDAGKTWSKPREITADVGGIDGFITSGRGCQLKDGTIAVIRTRPAKTGYCCVVVGSTDHGKTWKVLSSDFAPGDESKLAQLSDGSWYVNSRIGGKDLCRAVHVSKDNGKTWTTRLDTSLRDPHCNGAVLAAKGALWLTNCDSDKRMNAVLRVSRDDGKTWKTVETLTTGPAAYSDLVDMDDGRLLLVWEDDRGSILCRPYAK